LISGNAEWLAKLREARADDINVSSVGFRITSFVELSNVSKDRGIVKESVSDTSLEHSLAVWIPFDIPNGAPTKKFGTKDASPCASVQRKLSKL